MKKNGNQLYKSYNKNIVLIFCYKNIKKHLDLFSGIYRNRKLFNTLKTTKTLYSLDIYEIREDVTHLSLFMGNFLFKLFVIPLEFKQLYNVYTVLR